MVIHQIAAVFDAKDKIRTRCGRWLRSGMLATRVRSTVTCLVCLKRFSNKPAKLKKRKRVDVTEVVDRDS